VPPNISGIFSWWQTATSLFKSEIISLGVYSGTNPVTTFTWSGTAWVMKFTINSFASSSNPTGGKGFNLYLNVFN
jgi:hypothetical protein